MLPVLHRLAERLRARPPVPPVASLLASILERLNQMPTMQDLVTALGTLKTAITSGFADIETSITTEGATVVAALAAAASSGQPVDQSTLDLVNGMVANVGTAVAQAKTDIAAEIPAAPVVTPPAPPPTS